MVVSSYVVTGVEVSSLEGCNFKELQEVLSQKTVPANKRNILLQEQVASSGASANPSHQRRNRPADRD